MARDYDEEWEKMKAEFLNNRNQKKEKTRPQADWKNNLGNDWKQEATRIFREEQEKEKAQAKLNPTKHYTELSNFDMNNNGFIVENQGVVHILPRVHSHEDYIKRLFPKEFPQYEHEYYAINQLLNQGIRVRASRQVVFVTLTEMPNDEQIKAVEHIFNYISSIYSEAWIQIDSMEGFSVLVDKTEDIRPAIQKLLNPRNDREAGIMDWMKPKPKPQIEVERGEFAQPFYPLDENDKQVLRNYHDTNKVGEITPENLSKFDLDGDSLILRNDGNIDLLDDIHHFYMKGLFDSAGKSLKTRFSDISGRINAHELIHTLFEGGVRLYVTDSGNELNITAYQFPTKVQLNMIDLLDEKFSFERCFCIIYAHINGKTERLPFDATGELSWYNVRNQIDRKKISLQNPQNSTPEEAENRRRHDQITMFRDPNYGRKEQAPDWSPRQKQLLDLTPEQRAHLLRNLNLKPMTYKEKSAYVKSMTKLAAELDYEGHYATADIIDSMIREAQTGKHAYPPFADFTKNFLKKFIQIYNRGLKAKGVNSTDIINLVNKDTSYSSSWVLREDGTFDLLPQHHWNYISFAFYATVSEFKDTRTTRKNKENFEYFMGNAYKAIHTLFAGALRIYVYYSDHRNGTHLCVAGYQAPTGSQTEALRNLVNVFGVEHVSTDIELLNKRGLNKFGLSPQEFFNEVQTMNDDPTKEEQENLDRHQMIQMFRDQSYNGRIDSPPPIERDKKKLTQEEKNHMIKNLSPMQFRPEKSASIIEVANYFDKKGWYKEADQLMKLSQKGKRGMPKSTGLSDDFRNKFLAQYKIGLSAKNMNPRNFVSYAGRWSSSWIMHEDGTLDLLPQHHSTYMDEVAALIKSNVHPDDYYNYREMDTYRFIYDILEGAMRVYVQGNGISVAAFQAPTPQQIESIETMASFMTNPKVHGSVKMRHENPISFWDQTPDDASRAFWQANEEWSPKDIERNQTMKMFRQHDFDKPLKKEEKEPLTREQIQHLLDNL